MPCRVRGGLLLSARICAAEERKVREQRDLSSRFNRREAMHQQQGDLQEMRKEKR